jgi:hypothetical protein
VALYELLEGGFVGLFNQDVDVAVGVELVEFADVDVQRVAVHLAVYRQLLVDAVDAVDG